MQPTWDSLMRETDASVAALQTIYTRCRNSAAEFKAGRGSAAELERLLNQALPVTEVDRRLAFFISYLARDKRSPLIDYLFKSQRSCLLLLADASAAAIALGLDPAAHQIWNDPETGEFRVGARGASSGARSASSGTRDAPQGRERRRGRGHGRARGAEAVPAAKPPSASKPVMNYQAVLADLSAEAAATAPPATTYSAVARGLARVSGLPPPSTLGEAVAKLPEDAQPTKKAPEAAAKAPEAATDVAEAATDVAEAATKTPEAAAKTPEAVQSAKKTTDWSDMADEDDAELGLQAN